MKKPKFDKDGNDNYTFAPFELQSELDSEFEDVRLSFSDWDWIFEKYKDAYINDYYLNGYGIEGLVKTILITNGIGVEDPDIHFNSEGDTCYIHFKDLNLAIRTAELAAQMIKNRKKLTETAKMAVDFGFDD